MPGKSLSSGWKRLLAPKTPSQTNAPTHSRSEKPAIDLALERKKARLIQLDRQMDQGFRSIGF
jgi:hypothetical protein